MSGNFAIKGGGGGRLMANAILNFHFDFLHPSLSHPCVFNLKVKSHPVHSISPLNYDLINVTSQAEK